MVDDISNNTVENKNQENMNYSKIMNHYTFEEGPVLLIAWANMDKWPIVYVSKNVVQIIGYTEAECLAPEFAYADLIHPEDFPRIVEEVGRHLKQGDKHFEQVYRIRKKDGHYMWIRDYSAPMYEKSEVKTICGYIYDITKEQETERLLLEQNNRYFDIVEATQVGVWEWNLLTNELQVNHRYAEIIGYTLEELGELSIERWKTMTHPGDLDKVFELIHDHIEGRTAYYEAEFRMKHKDGHWIWLSDRGKVIHRTLDNKPIKMVGSHIDVTENKKTETMLYHSEKVTAIGRLAGGIAHDINNQLMMIQGYVDILKSSDAFTYGKEQLHNIEAIVTRSTDIVKQLQSFTKQTKLKCDDVEINSLVLRIGKMMYHAIDKRILIEVITTNELQKEPDIDPIRFRRETDMQEGELEELHINGDVSLIENALVNLVLNARDSIFDTGKISLMVKKVNIEKPMQTYMNSLDVGDYVCISVKDNGIGISEKNLMQIFEPFFTTKEKGTGLGLSMAISAIKQFNGGITVESRLGRGTIFSLYFPLVQNDITKNIIMNPEVGAVEENTQCDKTILIVDDELVLCDVLSQYLCDKGFNTKSFIDPRKALDYFEGHYESIECVILDVIMPYMTGNELFKKMLEISSKVKVLYLSGYTEGLSIHEAHSKNIIGLLEKPVKLEKIYTLLTHSIDGQNY
jgi:PAS domain S-box-containing protein